MEELNKKLAEWAGFYCLEGIWTIYDEDVMEPTLPDFTNSLDACFKWLVPRLWVRIDQMFGSWVGWASIKDSHNWQSGVSKDNPALALCLAIEKLIDGGK